MAIRRHNPLDVELEAKPRVDSDAAVRSARLYVSSDESQVHGIWEAEPGTHQNLPGQETVVILRGRATVTNEAGESIEVGPGDLVFIDAGEVTSWTIHETIRKVFVVNL